MKKIIVLVLILISSCFIGFSQNSTTSSKKNEDVTVSINISKINRSIGSVVGFIKSEIKEYKKDIDECLPEETKQKYRDEYNKTKAVLKQGFSDCVKEAHRGFRQGLRGEKYNPNKD